MTQANRIRALLGNPSKWTIVLPIVLAIVQVVGSIAAAARFHADEGGSWPLDGVAIALLVLGPVVLLFRKRWPAGVLVGVTTVSLVYALGGYPMGPFIFSMIVALVVAVRTGHRLLAWAALVVLLAGHWGLRVLLGTGEPPTGGEVGLVTGWMIVVLIGAEVLRSFQERRLERAQAEEVEAANRLTEERLRIARELHDVVAHNISLINVQAGAALHLMDRQPEQARSALSTIKAASKEALVELRSVLGVLRSVDEPDGISPRHPEPGLARLDELVDNARSTGLEVVVNVDGHNGLPSRVDVAAYRILQEAITNVLRHAQANRVDLDLSVADSVLRLEVADDGRGVSTETSGSRSGLLGMTERAEALGGTLEAGPRSGGGFRVRAELPIPDGES